MSDKISVNIGDKVVNIHTGEIFVVEQIFSMRRIGGGKYTSKKDWQQEQLLSAYDWQMLEDRAPAQQGVQPLTPAVNPTIRHLTK